MTISSYLHSYAQSLAVNALSRITGARILLDLAYQDPPEVVTVGQGEESDPCVRITVYDPGLWLKLLSYFDLVGFHSVRFWWKIVTDSD